MRLIDRYLLKELIVPTIFSFVGFFILFVAFDLNDNFQKFDRYELGATDILSYYVYVTPHLLDVVMPLSLFLGLLYCLAQHARSNELIAIRTAGVGVWRLALPYLAVGTFLSIGLFASNEWVMPEADRGAKHILHSRHSDVKSKTAAQWVERVNFNNEREGRFWHIDSFNLLTYTLVGVDITWQDEVGNTLHLGADMGRWNDNHWVFEGNVKLNQPDPLTKLPLRTLTNSLPMPDFHETPEMITGEIKINSLGRDKLAKEIRFSLQEIGDYLRRHPDLAEDKMAQLKTQWHGRLAMPLKCLVVVFMALPMGLMPGRRSIMAAVGLAIILVFSFILYSKVALALGTGNQVPGWFAGWSPALIFGSGGFWLIKRYS
ncbi:MAG: LptF/LptG family permease [Limisphaerales bacterium]